MHLVSFSCFHHLPLFISPLDFVDLLTRHPVLLSVPGFPESMSFPHPFVSFDITFWTHPCL